MKMNTLLTEARIRYKVDNLVLSLKSVQVCYKNYRCDEHRAFLGEGKLLKSYRAAARRGLPRGGLKLSRTVSTLKRVSRGANHYSAVACQMAAMFCAVRACGGPRERVSSSGKGHG